MGRRIAILVLAAATASAGLGCAAFPVIPSLPGLGGSGIDPTVQHATSVGLSEANYRVVQTGVRGESRGLVVLLLFRVIPTSTADALDRLYASAGLEPGGPWALANVSVEHQVRNFLLFGLPKVRIRADVVEFGPDPEAGDGHPISAAASAGEAGARSEPEASEVD